MWIDAELPGLTNSGYAVTSSPNDEYNCIAWATGDDSTWWSHLQGYRWPVERTDVIEGLVAVFASLGFVVCEDGSLEEEFEKVALYSRNGLWEHAARQLSSGQWTSKLGVLEDIEHSTPEGLCGNLYGTIHCFMKKRKAY